MTTDRTISQSTDTENGARHDVAWQATSLTNAYLEGVRGAIPLATEQIEVIIRLARAAQPNARLFLDLGCGDGILGHALL
ncbi:MAG TPA: hypothetical protein PKE20_13440, partial [Promineifilum sp.]|nr:hypothetical protein [Promineifilum sp.]